MHTERARPTVAPSCADEHASVAIGMRRACERKGRCATSNAGITSEVDDDDDDDDDALPLPPPPLPLPLPLLLLPLPAPLVPPHMRTSRSEPASIARVTAFTPSAIASSGDDDDDDDEVSDSEPSSGEPDSAVALLRLPLWPPPPPAASLTAPSPSSSNSASAASGTRECARLRLAPRARDRADDWRCARAARTPEKCLRVCVCGTNIREREKDREIERLRD